MYILGTAQPEQAPAKVPCILKLEKTPYAPGEAEALTSPDAWSKIETVRGIRRARSIGQRALTD